MDKVLYRKDGRIGRITLNRPEVMNAIDDDLPGALAAAMAKADADPGVHVMVLSGNGPAFCSGYDLAHYAEAPGPPAAPRRLGQWPAADAHGRAAPGLAHRTREHNRCSYSAQSICNSQSRNSRTSGAGRFLAVGCSR